MPAQRKGKQLKIRGGYRLDRLRAYCWYDSVFHPVTYAWWRQMIKVGRIPPFCEVYTW